jgi:hypothetical protein
MQESNMRISFFLTTSLYILMAYSTSIYADGIPQVPDDYPSHKALGNCYTTQQIKEIRQQLAEYNVTRVRVSTVLRVMSDKYKLSDDTRLRLLGFAESFEKMENNMPDPDPDSDNFRNFDFQLGLSFTALTVFLNTNEETTAQFADDRNNSSSELGLYLAELDSSREIYMSSLKPVSSQKGNDSACNKKF